MTTVFLASITMINSPVLAVTGIQIGASGKTYASAEVQCGLNPVSGMAPFVLAGLYNPKSNSSAIVSLNGEVISTVTFFNPDTNVWLANGINAVSLALKRNVTDSYSFDASLSYPGQDNMCIPDTSANTLNGDLEYAASLKSYTSVTSGCALNPLSGQTQPFVNLYDNGAYLLNVSINNSPLTQLNGTSRTHVAIFLSPGLNVISAVNGAVSTDFYVRDGGGGACTLP